ncbi:50S ribosomal protein L11 methyltransferase [Candidatus Bathyarchaeota archaeon]|nr:50S ribosomal protein L11 methyltransferase [Candidatus Bathyarchaeota archaeon]
MKDDNTKESDDFGERITGWHNLLGWGDGDDSVAPYVPTPMNVVKAMLEIAGAGPGDTVIDLGCGDARILTMAVEEFGADRAIGYELNKHLVETALGNIYRKNLERKVEIVEGNFMEADLSPATIVTLYLTTTGNAKLRPKFKEELRQGTRIISHDFPIVDWVTDSPDNEAVKVGTHKIFRYTVPNAYEVKIEPEKPSDDRWNRIKKLFDRL